MPSNGKPDMTRHSGRNPVGAGRPDRPRTAPAGLRRLVAPGGGAPSPGTAGSGEYDLRA